LDAAARCALTECQPHLSSEIAIVSEVDPTDDHYLTSYRALESAAYDPPTQASGFAACALLLREHLSKRKHFSVPDDVWFMIEDAVRSAPYPRRAAFHRALREASDAASRSKQDEWSRRVIGGLQEPIQPFPQVAVDAVVKKLRATASSLDRQSIEEISQADYGSRADEHAKVLTKLVAEGNFILSREMYWAPSEVIELTAHDPMNRSYFVCCAILMINELNGSIMDYMEFRWGRNGRVFLANDTPLGDTLLRGFRLLLEGDYPFYSMQWHEMDGSRCEMIPYFDDWRS